MDLWMREARIFKYGSGTGTNFSALRGENEPLSGGGKSSGLMSFLKIGDRAAGAIKSGGTTRRAAKMVCLDLDHPDIEEFIALEGGGGAEGRGPRRGLAGCAPAAATRVMSAMPRPTTTRRIDAESEDQPARSAQRPARGPRGHGPRDCISSGRCSSPPRERPRHRLPRVRHRLGQRGVPHRRRARTRTTSCACRTTSSTRSSRDGELDAQAPHRRRAAKKRARPRRCGTRSPTPRGPAPIPGVQYDTTINEWHTCPADGRINATQPVRDRRHARRHGRRLAAHRRAARRGPRGDRRRRRRCTRSGRRSHGRASPSTACAPRPATTLKLTADHRVLTANRGDVPACELTPDDVVLLGRPRLRRREALDPRVGEFLGLDGGRRLPR